MAFVQRSSDCPRATLDSQWLPLTGGAQDSGEVNKVDWASRDMWGGRDAALTPKVESQNSTTEWNKGISNDPVITVDEFSFHRTNNKSTGQHGRVVKAID